MMTFFFELKTVIFSFTFICSGTTHSIFFPILIISPPPTLFAVYFVSTTLSMPLKMYVSLGQYGMYCARPFECVSVYKHGVAF